VPLAEGFEETMKASAQSRHLDDSQIVHLGEQQCHIAGS
jgi:hypothetical protein